MCRSRWNNQTAFAMTTRERGDVRLLGVAAAALALILDQLSKAILLYGFSFIHLAPGDVIRVTPFLNLVMVWNRGVSFGLFQTDDMTGRMVLLAFSGAVVLALIVWLRSVKIAALAIGIGLVVGGALGNMIDRVVLGAVADFFHLHAFGYDWYVFNVADAAIVFGVGVLIFESLFGREPSQNKVGT